MEEIVVTAQRREQVTQDVPVSLEVFGGQDISRHGLETLKDLSIFAPGLIVQDKGEEQGLIMRGAGSQSKNLALEQGVPTFIDGIHFGRASQVKNQFLDLEQVEVLKGPQPVYFGQNAGAGALNITTRKPGPEWSGNLKGEFGNFGSREIEGAFGGPITDTLGIRVAGRYDILEGFLRDYFTGQKFPERESKAARLTLQWTPMEQFQATGKIEVSRNELGARPTLLVRNSAPLDIRQGESVLVSGISTVSNVPDYNAPVGKFTKVGLGQGFTPSLSPSLFGNRIINANGPTNTGGVLDITQCTSLAAPGLPIPKDFENCDFKDDAEVKPWNALMDLSYELGNGIQVNSKTGFSHHVYHNSVLNTGGPIITNPRSRNEEFDQWSTELRFTSPTDGVFSWMAGFYWQKNDHDMQNLQMQTDSLRSIRGSIASVDSTWTSGFATVTYNFFDDKASLDLGARYTHVKEHGQGRNTTAEWIVAHPITGEPTLLPLGRSLLPRASDLAAGYDVEAVSGVPTWGFNNAVILGRTAIRNDASQFHPLALPSFVNNSLATNDADYKENNFDPQVVLRYRPTDDLSLYAKWVESTKAGGFDGGVTEITTVPETWTFGPEAYESYEIGSRGVFFDNRVRVDLSAYLMKIKGQQVSNIDPVLRRNITKNVASAETKGIEALISWAASDRLSVNTTLSFMDGEIVSFPNSVCVTDELLAGLCTIDANGASVRDRSGLEARNAPDYQVTGWLNYELPTIIDGYRANFSAVVVASAAYTDNRNFSDVISYDSSEDANVALEIGNEGGEWSMIFWARNLGKVRPTLHVDREFSGDGILSASDGAQIGMEGFTSYGITFQFNFGE